MDNVPLIDFSHICEKQSISVQGLVLSLEMMAQGEGVALVGGAAWELVKQSSWETWVRDPPSPFPDAELDQKSSQV